METRTADQLLAEYLEAESTARAHIEMYEREIDNQPNLPDDGGVRCFVNRLEDHRRKLVKDYERQFSRRYPERGAD